MRSTPIRTALLAILGRNKKPLTPQEILFFLDKKGFKVNKTTVYRQLETLMTSQILNEVNLADRVKRYELADKHGHHHHLVCVKCGGIEDVVLSNDLKRQEKMIWQKNKFKVSQHSLEFFGTCHKCSK